MLKIFPKSTIRFTIIYNNYYLTIFLLRKYTLLKIINNKHNKVPEIIVLFRHTQAQVHARTHIDTD